MSRSYRVTKIFGMGSGSEKKDKRLANRQHRRVTKIEVAQGRDIISRIRELSDIWGFKKDGKRYLNDIETKWMRK